MPGHQPSSEGAPSADVLKERVDEMGRDLDLGEGNDEPDPATADNPPRAGGHGNREREQH